MWQKGSEDPAVGILQSPFAFRQGIGNSSLKTAKEVAYGVGLYFTSKSLNN